MMILGIASIWFMTIQETIMQEGLFYLFNNMVCIPDFKANKLYFFLQVLNKIDLPGAEPEKVLKEIEEVGDSLHCLAHFMMF